MSFNDYLQIYTSVIYSLFTQSTIFISCSVQESIAFQVLLYLQKFSQNMILKTHELEKVVDNLAYETKVFVFLYSVHNN